MAGLFDDDVMMAAIMDAGVAFGGGQGNNMGRALQNRQAMRLAQAEVLEAKRLEQVEREQREKVAQLWNKPDREVQTGFPLRDDRDMFYDTSEYDTNPAARDEIESLLGNYNEMTVPGGPPTSGPEIRMATSRVLGGGAAVPETTQRIINALLSSTDPVNVAAGGASYDPMTEQVIHSQPTQDQQKYQAAVQQGFQGTLTEFMQQIKKPLVNVNMPGQDMLAKEADFGFDQIKAGRENLQSRSETMMMMNSAAEDLKKFKTGSLGNERLELSKALSMINASDKAAVAAGERLKSTINDIVMGKMDYLKGAMSEKELKFLEESTIGMDTTVEGNLAIIDLYRKAGRRMAEKQQALEGYFYGADNGGVPRYHTRGFNEYWDTKKKTWDEQFEPPTGMGPSTLPVEGTGKFKGWSAR